ncbi:MAG TPA: ATP-dependent DNA helicase PcrA, partial [Armatimonadetes bacterium]|nr:ATP-dependent DNA helicase PcrA [Armatimonadota bacterium]
MASVLDGLNPEQREAASHVEGPCLVVAGAGSGKTRMLTHRIAYLLTECDVAPWHVLAVTFTNKAAAEMRGRVDELVGPRAKRVWMGTFHSICARLLREFAEQAGLQSNFTIFDEDDRGTLLRRICRALDLDVQRFPPKQFGWRISDLKNELLDYDQYIADFDGLVTPPERVFRRVYERYQQELRAQNAVDFDDLILRAVRLVEGQLAVRAKLAERFRYVMVDEYQDINRAQYRLVRALSAEHRNLCVVGDDDQSIYGWRGARVEIILGFEDDYPEAKIVKLERNYRSTAAVLNAAGAVIARNAGRRPKTLRAVIAGGAPVRLRVAQDAADEAFYVADLIRKGQHEGRSYGDYAILYRTNAQSRAFEQVFTTARVPYRMVGGVRFYERREIRDLIAYLRALFNPTDNVSLDRIINVPARGIGNKTTEAIATRALEREISHREALATLLADDDTTLGTAARRRLLDFHQLFERLTAMLDTLPVAELVGAIFEQTGYRAALAAEDSIESAARLENIDQLVTAAHEMTEAPGRDGVEQFLERVALVSDLDSLDSSGDSVTLMTLHSAKGLEFPVVF